MKYDLEERVAIFGENIIELAKSIASNNVTKSLVPQIVRSGTSIGANYMEANQAVGEILEIKLRLQLRNLMKQNIGYVCLQRQMVTIKRFVKNYGRKLMSSH